MLLTHVYQKEKNNNIYTFLSAHIYPYFPYMYMAVARGRYDVHSDFNRGD